MSASGQAVGVYTSTEAEKEGMDAGTVMDTLMGCVTLWAWYKCRESTYSKAWASDSSESEEEGVYLGLEIGLGPSLF